MITLRGRRARSTAPLCSKSVRCSRTQYNGYGAPALRRCGVVVALLGDKAEKNNAASGVCALRIHALVHLTHVLPKAISREGARLLMLGVVRLHVHVMHVLPARVGVQRRQLVHALGGDRQG